MSFFLFTFIYLYFIILLFLKNVFNESGGLITNNTAGTLISSSNEIIYSPNLFSYLGPFETYNPSLNISMKHSALEGQNITIFSTNNINYFLSNALTAFGEYSTH
jgi:hypothetical protein